MNDTIIVALVCITPFICFSLLLGVLAYIFFIDESKSMPVDKVKLIHEITDMIKALDNSELSTEDKQSTKTQ